MPIVLKIESGAQANTLLPIEVGRKLRVGRTEQADHAIPEDRFLSRVHFEIEWDGEACVVRDLKSNNGLQLNGSPVGEAKLKHGDRILAGETLFSISIPVADAALAFDEAARFDRLLSALRSRLQPLYAVVNAAQEPSILRILRESGAQPMSLFEGEAMYRLVHFAPYLVALPADSALLPTLVREGWGKNWGVYLSCPAAPMELLYFLKRLLTTQFPSGQTALLRYYDPRVLRTLIASSTAHQARQLFGPVRLFLMEGEDPEVAVGFSLTTYGLDMIEVPLAGDGQAKTTRIESARHTGPMTRSLFAPSPAQMELLEKQKKDTFLEGMLVDLAKLFPERFKGEGAAEKVRELAEYGCKRPQRYGIRSQADITRYVRLMMRLGRDFDMDEAMPWAARLLGMRLPPGEKLSRLEAAAAAV